MPFSRPGALTIAVDDDQAQELPRLLEEASAAGTRAELISGERARELEPMITPECRGALHLPDEGLIDPMRLTCAYAELAAANGAEIRLDCPALGFTRTGERLTAVDTPAGRLEAGYVVNAAGVAGGRVSALAGGEELQIWPRKGQYWILDRAFGDRLQMMVLPVPMPHTRGVQVVPTTNGSVLLGPDAQEITDADDKSTDLDSLEVILEQTERLVPSVTLDSAIKTYAANRAACEETVRVRPDARVPNLFHVGNRSTGVSASPGTADHVLELLREAGLAAADRADAVRALAKIRRLLLDEDPESSARCRPRYRPGRLRLRAGDCRRDCRAHYRSRVPARSIEGVRKRTRATAGRCQGSVCMAGVAFLCSLHTGQDPRPTFDRDPTAQRSALAVSASRMAVVGAGIAGLAAAAELSARGHVTLLDRLPVAGGVLGYEADVVRELEGRCAATGVRAYARATAIRWTDRRALDRGAGGIAGTTSTPRLRRRRPPGTQAELRIPGRGSPACCRRRWRSTSPRPSVVLGRRVAIVGAGDWAARVRRTRSRRSPSASPWSRTPAPRRRAFITIA